MTNEEKMVEVQKIYDRTMNELQKLEAYILKHYLKDMKDALYKINFKVINEWYMSYDPSRYVRTFDLFNYLKVKVDYNKYTISVVFDAERSKHWHRVDEINGSYIFYNSFIAGYHGGADDFLRNPPLAGYEEPHPCPGEPYWRYPPYSLPGGILIWQHWFPIKAIFTFSPYDMIIEEAQGWKDELVEYYDTIYSEKVAEIADRIKEQLLEVLKK